MAKLYFFFDTVNQIGTSQKYKPPNFGNELFDYPLEFKIEQMVSQAPVNVFMLSIFAARMIKRVESWLLMRQTMHQRTPLRNKIWPRFLAMSIIRPIRAEAMHYWWDILGGQLEPERSREMLQDVVEVITTLGYFQVVLQFLFEFFFEQPGIFLSHTYVYPVRIVFYVEYTCQFGDMNFKTVLCNLKLWLRGCDTHTS